MEEHKRARDLKEKRERADEQRRAEFEQRHRAWMESEAKKAEDELYANLQPLLLSQADLEAFVRGTQPSGRASAGNRGLRR